MPNLPNCCFTDTVVPSGVSFLQAGCGPNIVIIILNFRNLENQAADCNELKQMWTVWCGQIEIDPVYYKSLAI